MLVNEYRLEIQYKKVWKVRNIMFKKELYSHDLFTGIAKAFRVTNIIIIIIIIELLLHFFPKGHF